MQYIGIDLHLKQSFICILNEKGEKVEELILPSKKKLLETYFSDIETSTICIEAGSHSPWVDRLLTELGHIVYVGQPRKIRLIAESTLKNDRLDAEVLARLVRADPKLISPIQHRSEETQILRSTLRVRSVILQSRSRAINCVRGLLRTFGISFPVGYPEAFPRRVREKELPDSLKEMVAPLLETIEYLSQKVAILDKKIENTVVTDPITKSFQEIPGIGPIIAFAFVTCIDNPDRFGKSRSVGAFLGLRPRLRESGGKTQLGRISKEGDVGLRSLLVQGAQAMLRSNKSCALKSWAENLIPRIGKRKATVALARKLAVVMHRMWVTNQPYCAFP